jgi:hypothetical protein
MLTGVPQINQSDLSIMAKFTIKNGTNLIVFGNAGIGKTEIAMQACDELGYAFKYLNLSVLEAPDLIGLPNVNSLGKTTYAPPDGFPLLSENVKECVLLVDEIDKAKPELQNPMLELFQFRSINGNKFKFRAVLATGNLPDENAHSQTVSHALTNRCQVYQVTHSFEAWQTWAVEAQVNPLIVGFLSRHTNELLQPPPEGDETAYNHPSPRAWTLAARDLIAADRESLDFQQFVIASRVGAPAATKFRVWLEHYRHIQPQIDDLVKDGKHPDKNMSLDRLFVCAIAGVDSIMDLSRTMAQSKSKDEINKKMVTTTTNVFNWLKVLPSEVCVGAVKSTLSMKAIADNGLTKIPTFMEVFTKIRKAMND